MDTDGDGTPDCLDGYPNDPAKLEPGLCGCGVPDTDTDTDGVADCLDECPDAPKKTEPGNCGCGVSEDSCDELDNGNGYVPLDMMPQSATGCCPTAATLTLTLTCLCLMRTRAGHRRSP